MSNFIVGNLVAEVKRGIKCNRSTVFLARSQYGENLVRFLLVHNYIQNYKVDSQNRFCISLRYVNNKSFIHNLELGSKPTQKIYLSYSDLVWNKYGYSGVLVLSTSFGIMTHFECILSGIGGKFLFSIFF
jgi:ribosomal protein S8